MGIYRPARRTRIVLDDITDVANGDGCFPRIRRDVRRLHPHLTVCAASSCFRSIAAQSVIARRAASALSMRLVK